MSTTQLAEGRRAHPEHIGHVIFITASAAMGGFLFGYDSSVINGTVVAIRDRFGVGSELLAQVIAAALIGCAIGAAAAGRIADRVGRIRVMQMAALLFTASAIGSALAFSIWDLAFWRVSEAWPSVWPRSSARRISPRSPRPPTGAGWAPSSRPRSSSASPPRSS